MSGALRGKIVARIEQSVLARILDESLDDHDLIDAAGLCGIDVETSSREDLVGDLVRRTYEDPDAGEQVVRCLVRANQGIIDQMQTMDIPEVRQALVDGWPEHVGHRGSFAFALLADERREVNAMLERFFDRRTGRETAEGNTAAGESGNADWVSEELRKELAQARQERAELMSLLKEVRTLLERANTAGPVALSDEEPAAERRAGLFVDVQNVFYNARNYYGRKLDFKKLVDVTTKDRTLVTAVAYLVLSPEVDQSNFITMLEQNGYSVREKLPRRKGDNLNLTEDELPMALDVLRRAENLDVAVLVGGDGDILSLSQRIQSGGAKVEFYGFPQNIADDVVRVVDRFVPIDDSLLLPQDYAPKRAMHDGQHRLSDRSGVTRGYVSQQRRAWGSDRRGA